MTIVPLSMGFIQLLRCSGRRCRAFPDHRPCQPDHTSPASRGWALDGKVNKEILTKLYQGWVYDTAVAEARETGKVEGRNEQIETRRVRTQKTDGLPADGGGVEATSAVKTDKDIIDEVITRRNKRRF